MKLVVQSIEPMDTGAVDVHIQIHDLKAGHEAAVSTAFQAIRAALEGDGRISLMEALTIALALSTMAR